jgi:hypothetical protein
LTDPTLIETNLIHRNIEHFGQANNTPLAEGQLWDWLGYSGTNRNCQNLIKGRLPPNIEQHHPATQLLLRKLADGKGCTEMLADITYEDFRDALKRWKESTSTSPSGRHLGHYKVLLLQLQSEEESNTRTDEIKTNGYKTRATQILETYWRMLQLTFKFQQPFSRWKQSLTTMIQKIPGNSRIDKLRVIHLYEADYNHWLKLLWGRKLVQHSNNQNKLNEGQYGSRPGKEVY